MKVNKNKKTNVKKYQEGGTIPAGMILGGAQAALGIGQAIYGMAENKKANKEISRIRAAAPSLSTPAEYYNYVKESYDQTLMNRQLEELNRSLATSVQALGTAGGRALVGGINEATRGAAVQKNILTERQNQIQGQALQTLAGAREAEIGRREQRFQTDLNYAFQNKQAAMAQIAGGVSSAVEGVGYGILDYMDSKGDDVPKNPYEGFERRVKKSKIADYETGGMMTGGKFDHNTNPIDLMKNGKKVGEVTGGEAVLNPKQQAMVAKESKYARKLFKKFKKEANKK